MSDDVHHLLRALSSCLTETHFNYGTKYSGKVRDVYDLGDELLFITTDRQSAFDRVLASVPFKGQVLNLTSAWWFDKTRYLMPNHMLSVPDPNVMLVKKCTVFPVEFVVRGYITGTTSTSLWTQYSNGVREYCGHSLPEGLKKNQPLAYPMLTPTTKDSQHDRPITYDLIIKEKLMTEAQWEVASTAALNLYAFGVEKAAERGLILVDTKYEMGQDSDGNIVLVDEIHTPDSSRYWIKASYEERFLAGKEPLNIDKEFLRLWFKDHCDPYHDEILPEAPVDLVVSLAARYIQLYEMITGNKFIFPTADENPLSRIARNLENTMALM